MKRRELIRHLEAFGCYLLKEGRKHSRFVNLGDTSKQATVPRHRADIVRSTITWPE